MTAKKKVFLLVISILFIALIYINMRGVYFENDGEGFGYLHEDGKTVRFFYANHITNISFIPKTVTFEAYSYTDAEWSYIKEPKLKVVSLGVYGESILDEVTYLEDLQITIEPFKSYGISIECEGEYGGVGNGVRHPPDTVKIKY